MPSSLFADGGVQGDALDEQRALQIALDQLSLLDLDNDENPLYDNNQEPRKKSVNMTECVPVPSSEHVAEIVGRQGVCSFLFHARCCAVPLQRSPELLLAEERGVAPCVEKPNPTRVFGDLNMTQVCRKFQLWTLLLITRC